MKCPNCGRELKTGQLYCEYCGQEIQIVPDYDPLDELLIGSNELMDAGTGKMDSEESAIAAGRPETPQQRRISAVREKREKGRFLFPLKWCLLLGGLLVCFGAFVFSYSLITRENSYSWQLRHGKALVEKEAYEEAVPYLKRADELQAEMEGAALEPLLYLAQAYAHTGADELAADCMEDAIDREASARGDNDQLLQLYLDYMEILNLTGQTERIEEVIEDCAYPEIREQLLPYRVEKPSCDVPEGTYGYYLRLELSAEYGSIYYTLDGTTPTAESTRYEKPIELQDEGETLLSAIAINKKGMASEPLVLAYRLEFQGDSY